MAKRNPGPWQLRGVQIRGDNGRGIHIATYQTCMADGILLAAAPELLDLLDSACRSLDAAESGASAHGTAVTIRERLHELGLWKLQTDEHGNPNAKDDPEDLNPNVERRW